MHNSEKTDKANAFNLFTNQIWIEECIHRRIRYGELPIGGISGEKMEERKKLVIGQILLSSFFTSFFVLQDLRKLRKKVIYFLQKTAISLN